MSRNSHKPTISIKKFPGLATANEAVGVGYSGLMQAHNVDITRQQKVRRRKGATQKVAAGTGTFDSAWGDAEGLIVTQKNKLYTVDSTFTMTLMRSDLIQTNQLCAFRTSAGLVYSNGLQTGCIVDGVDRALGVAPPPTPSATEYSVGQLPKGAYQVVYTYARADGFESGAGIAATVNIAQAHGGLNIAYVASSNPAVDKINIYISRPDGTVLYYAKSVRNITGNTTYQAHVNFLKRALRTQFKATPPAFTAIDRTVTNRMLYAKDKLIYLSDAYAPEHITDGESFLPFADTVNMIGVVATGFFVGTSVATYFVALTDKLETAQMIFVAPYGVVPGTRSYMDASVLEGGVVSGILPVWMSHKGLCVGMPDGTVKNLTHTSVIIPKGVKGTTLFRQEDGQNHIISVIQK